MKGFPLLIPDVSRGNVGQLTADLLISTLKVCVRCLMNAIHSLVLIYSLAFSIMSEFNLEDMLIV